MSSLPPEIQTVDSCFIAAAQSPSNLPAPVGIEIAFAGRSNVGKSSLLNSLFARKKLVRTSSTPGCTRQINLFEVKLKDGLRLTFADLPGYGYAKRSKKERSEWHILIESYLLERPTLAVVVLLVDARRGLEAEELNLIQMLSGPAKVTRRALQVVLVATKIDKLPASSRKTTLARLQSTAPQPIHGYSVRLPEVRTELWRTLRKAIE